MNQADEIAWHYPRTELARSYVGTFRAVLISSVGFFAPRRKGKTEFLLQDLLPAAKLAGYSTVYCSMWQNRSDPLAALLLALSLVAEQVIFPSQRGINEIEDEQLARWLAVAPGAIDGATPDDIEPA